MSKKTQYQRISHTKEQNKPNEKIPIAIKPYWYIDPSIVYRAMTSPVKLNNSPVLIKKTNQSIDWNLVFFFSF